MLQTGLATVSPRRSILPERGQGFTLIEIALALSLIGAILVGVMATFSTGFIAQRNNSQILENQLLTQQVLEEIQDSPFADLLSFNGTTVDSADGKNRATITVTSLGVDLVRIQVVSTSLSRPEIFSRGITMISNPN